MTQIQTVHLNHIALQAGKLGARSVEVGAQALTFKKSATEPKLN